MSADTKQQKPLQPLASSTLGMYHSAVDTLKGAGHMTITMPCLRCGKPLDQTDDGTNYVACSCGAHYDYATIDFHKQPGFYREWIAALSCTCGRVEHYSDEYTITLQRHRCRAGGVGMLPRPSTN